MQHIGILSAVWEEMYIHPTHLQLTLESKLILTNHSENITGGRGRLKNKLQATSGQPPVDWQNLVPLQRFIQSV